MRRVEEFSVVVVLAYAFMANHVHIFIYVPILKYLRKSPSQRGGGMVQYAPKIVSERKKTMKREWRSESTRLGLACLAVFGLVVAGRSSAATVLQADGTRGPCIGTDVQAPPGQDAEFTMEAWIKPSDIYGGHWICGQGGNGAGTFTLRTYQNKLSVMITKRTSTGMTSDFSGLSDASIALDTWQHVACVRKPTEIRLYVNGVLDKTFTPADMEGSSTKFPNINDGDLQSFMIGGLYGTSFDTYVGNNSWTYKGRMAEVRLWSGARTDAEIAANCSNRLTGAEANLIGYWPMSDSAGRTFKNFKTGIPAVVPANFTVTADETLPLARNAERLVRGICFCWNTNATQKANLTGLTSLSSTYNYLRPGEDFSFEAWVKIDPALTNAPGWTSTAQDGGVAFFQQYRQGQTGRMTASLFNGGRFCVFWMSAGNMANYLVTPDPLPVNKWVHLAVVLGSEGQFISIDGEPVVRASKPYDGLSQPEATNTQNGYNQMFCMYQTYTCLREVRVWRRARTEAEVRAQRRCKFKGRERYLIYYNPCSQKTPGTSDWYWFNYVRESPWVAENPGVAYGADLNAPASFLYDDVPFLEPVVVEPDSSFATFNGTKFTHVSTGVNITTADFTLEAWIFPRSFKTSGNYVFSQYAVSQDGRMLVRLPAGKPAFSIYSSDTSLGTQGELDSTGTIPTNVWTHIAAVREGGRWTIYTNGLVAVTATGRSTCPLYTGGSLGIGFMGVAEKSAFNGHIRDVRVWRRARTQEEIARYRFNTLDGRHPDLIGYWPLDTDTGSVCTDAKTGAVGTMNVGWTPTDSLALGEPVYGSPRPTIIVIR